MQLRHPSFSYSAVRPRDVRIGVQTVQQALDEWLLDCEIRQLSERTVLGRKETIKELLNFFSAQKFDTVGVSELKRFMAHLGSPNRLSDRGFDGKKNGRALTNTPLSSSSIAHHYAIVRTFFRWMTDEELIDASPFDAIAPPINREDQIRPFTDEEVLAIIAKAKVSVCAKRDEAIILFLFDTGIRASELVSLKFKDMEFNAHRCEVVGKGNKKRMIAYSTTCGRALWRYLRGKERQPDDPVFMAERGGASGNPLTRNGLYQILKRLVRDAGITRPHIGPHTFRHTFAIDFLRNGGNLFTLQQRLGHTNLDMTRRYAAFAEADIERQARMYSPADRLLRK